jgi:hypothetical protein
VSADDVTKNAISVAAHHHPAAATTMPEKKAAHCPDSESVCVFLAPAVTAPATTAPASARMTVLCSISDSGPGIGRKHTRSARRHPVTRGRQLYAGAARP